MKALETEYNGILFRSRLEARWAILFDALNLEYVYEPECYVLSNNQKYTPDFYIKKYNLFIEIKPNYDWLKNEYHFNRYKLFEKQLLVLSGDFPNFDVNYLFNCYADDEGKEYDGDVVFCPNTKYEPFFYSGYNIGESNDDFENDYYKEEIKIVKQYRFY